ncbi:MAG TPA: NAD(P)-dependent oxidoreductase [Pseudonocardia sp.]|jgi:2-hydroxy-3-oxopropionate reductase|uniref:NAD(P)-dependent oxidoreductase n=1 Tax=Pseudonocardia sp. TaxID=60912 RepID=UPI002C4F1409|nr:NAD(P)-dependent oxidoreductase [Pseudonocardia sp.]HTF47109.1 NAD(P)-dependent oxidoreductase [Pseudonocardia sp.]
MSNTYPRVTVAGLGAMGEPMARVLLTGGYPVTVVPHRRRDAAEALAAEGATIAKTVAEAAGATDVVITLVPDLPQLLEVAEGPDGLVAGALDGLTLLNMSTVAPDGLTALAGRLAEHGIRVVDAPVSGGPARAADGTLTIMTSGADADIDHVSGILDTLGQRVFRTGPLGTSQVAKLCNNMIAATIMVANAEALTLGAKAGLDPAQLREIVLSSSGGSTVLDTWVPRNLLRDVYEPGFALKLMYKDAGLARDLARQIGVPMPLANLTHELYGFLAQGPGAEADYSFVSTLFQDAANVTIATGRPRKEM